MLVFTTCSYEAGLPGHASLQPKVVWFGEISGILPLFRDFPPFYREFWEDYVKLGENGSQNNGGISRNNGGNSRNNGGKDRNPVFMWAHDMSSLLHVAFCLKYGGAAGVQLYSGPILSLFGPGNRNLERRSLAWGHQDGTR